MQQTASQVVHQPQPLVQIINSGSIVDHMQSSQVHPVNTVANTNIPLNPSLIPYPADNKLYPGGVLNLPGKVEHSKIVDDHGNMVEITKQSGNFSGPVDDGGSYESTYLYKSSVQEEGEGQLKVTKQVTEIRTNQTVNWISKSRVLEEDPTLPKQIENTPQ